MADLAQTQTAASSTRQGSINSSVATGNGVAEKSSFKDWLNVRIGSMTYAIEYLSKKSSPDAPPINLVLLWRAYSLFLRHSNHYWAASFALL